MSASLIDCLATTEALAAVFSDRSVIQAMLDFEGALAHASAAAGVIPSGAAGIIAGVAAHAELDVATIAAAARADATPAIPMVKALRERVEANDRDAATYVHWGATSQDLTDTALVLLLQRAQGSIAGDQARLARALRALSDQHAGTVMVGRTLLQPAAPITLGLKAAAWLAQTARSWRRLEREWHEAMVIQLGGAVGTRAAFGEQGMEIAAAMARGLGLRVSAPWHTDRDRLGALVGACGLYLAGLAKIAKDVTLLMQGEIGEAAEPGGGSSSMPQKRNPAGCALVLAAATRVPGLVASFLSAMPQEHERGAGGIQAEWPIVSTVVQSTGAAVAALAGVIEGLHVDVTRIRTNLEATRGTIVAERAVLLLARSVGRRRAQRLVADALAASRLSGLSFAEAVRSAAATEPGVPADLFDDLDRPERYLGSADAIRAELIGGGEAG